MEVKIKKLSENAIIPKYALEGDAGLDLVATTYKQVLGNHIYGTGLAVEIPSGYVGLIFPRSSNRKTDAYLTNSVGVIDSGYRGEITVTYKNRTTLKDFEKYAPYQIGNKIAQLIILPYPKIELVEVEELSETERGENGHGSTGN